MPNMPRLLYGVRRPSQVSDLVVGSLMPGSLRFTGTLVCQLLSRGV